AEYGLSSDEGVALMCLAEALLRIPDARTIDALIDDKIAGSDWSVHLGQSGSLLVNSSTLGLLLAGQVLNTKAAGGVNGGAHGGATGVADTLQGLARRMGTPAIRAAVSAVIKQMGRQFVLGETIQAAMARAAREEAQGFTFSYDMLGEAALTAADADRFRTAYQHAIAAIAARCTAGAVADNPGISIKLSALHPRYEVAQADRVLAELVPVVVDLARRAAAAGMGLNIDAEEADRLGMSLAVIRAVLADPALSGWDGFGVVVQGYGRRAGDVIDGLYAMAVALDRRLMVRLVKGAYWDTEIKHAQVEGLDGYPVFTQKPASDVSFIALSRRLLGMTDRLYPQFATHNAHSVAAILEMAAAVGTNHYEFQRLHGMGEALYRHLLASEGVRCRVYAPVGAHRELLAYLVRRLLENGANSSFVNQIVDDRIAPEDIVACPFDRLARLRRRQSPPIPLAPDLFQPERPNARPGPLPSQVAIDGSRDRAAVAQEREITLP
ncbi:MAG: proline dehydrogenase family protein, partial [Pseudomonadota bacterium]|nr:proline dehydrogenase family protein [Pseudomonadota bacterium]